MNLQKNSLNNISMVGILCVLILLIPIITACSTIETPIEQQPKRLDQNPDEKTEQPNETTTDKQTPSNEENNNNLKTSTDIQQDIQKTEPTDKPKIEEPSQQIALEKEVMSLFGVLILMEIQ